jgi:hypothetical protein
MIITSKTKSYSDLYNSLGLTFNLHNINNLSTEALLGKKKQLLDEISMLKEEKEKIQQFLVSNFEQYRPQLKNFELQIRQKYRDSLSSIVIKKKKSSIDQVKVRNYQNEVIHTIKNYNSTYWSYYENFVLYIKKMDFNENIIKNLETFIKIIGVLKNLYEFEGYFFLFDGFNIVLSTSGIHIVYNAVPEKYSEDEFRNALSESIREFFSNFFGKSVDFVIEIYALDQYKHLHYEDMKDTTKSDVISYFSKILDTKHVTFNPEEGVKV